MHSKSETIRFVCVYVFFSRFPFLFIQIVEKHVVWFCLTLYGFLLNWIWTLLAFRNNNIEFDELHRERFSTIFIHLHCVELALIQTDTETLLINDKNCHFHNRIRKT